MCSTRCRAGGNTLCAAAGSIDTRSPVARLPHDCDDNEPLLPTLCPYSESITAQTLLTGEVALTHTDALGYLIGEKLFTFLWAAERDPLFAAELPDFIREIRRLFTAEDIRDYLDRLENTKYLAPRDPDLEMDDLDELDDPDEDEPLLENPVMGAEELLRFSRVRQLLQS